MGRKADSITFKQVYTTSDKRDFDTMQLATRHEHRIPLRVSLEAERDLEFRSSAVLSWIDKNPDLLREYLDHLEDTKHWID